LWFVIIVYCDTPSGWTDNLIFIIRHKASYMDECITPLLT